MKLLSGLLYSSLRLDRINCRPSPINFLKYKYLPYLDRYHNVPYLYYPFVLMYWWIGSLSLIFLYSILKLTYRVKIEGLDQLDEDQNYLIGLWHESAIFASFVKWRKINNTPLLILTADQWSVVAIWGFAKWIGVDKILNTIKGQSGTGEIASQYISQGCSTMITPDGPKGPRRHLKSGILSIAKKTNTPILPVEIICSNAWVWKTSWDQKAVPLPFSTVRVIMKKPVYVVEGQESEAAKIISESCGK